MVNVVGVLWWTLLVWQRLRLIASGSGQPADWLDLVEHSWFTHDNTVTFRGFVSLTLAQLLTPEQLTQVCWHATTQCERHVLELDAFGHVSHQWTYVVWHVVAPIASDGVHLLNWRSTARQMF